MLKNLNLNSPRVYLLGFLAAAAVTFAAGTVSRYHGVYVGPPIPQEEPESVASLANAYEGSTRVYGPGKVAVFDVNHGNGYRVEEMGLLAGRLAAAGAQVEFSGDFVSRGSHEAAALIIPAPDSTFSRDEVLAIERFAAKGGRVILIGDPTRVYSVEGLNSLASEFGVLYQQDYIYNLEKNDGNFRNVIFSNFAEDNPLTDGLDSVIFQTAHSLRATGDAGLVMGDDSTFVSSSEKPGGVIAMAIGGEGNVLFLSDMTFLTPPYNSFGDNDRLIDNLVDFALGSPRQFTVDDFPYYMGATTDVVYQDPTMLDDAFSDFDSLRDRLEEAEKTVALVDEVEKGRPLIYVATYDDVDEDIADALEDSGVSLEGRQITIEDVTTLSFDQTALFHLIPPPARKSSSTATPEPDEEPPAYQLIVLASDKDALATGIDRLVSGDIGDCVVTPQTAVCQTDEEKTSEGPGEGPDTGLGNGGAPTPANLTGTFLVIADDETSGDPESTSAPAMMDALVSVGHIVDMTTILGDGLPTASEMLDYDAVFWSSGNYGPSFDSINVLTEYLESGGRLFIDGAEVAFYWNGDPFLTEYLRAEYVSYGEQLDLELGLIDHPLNAGFGGATILLESGSPPDIIEALGSDVVFVRGPQSVEPGLPSLVAYETGDRRVAFAAFQVSLMDEFALQQLISNAANWFLAP